MLNYHPFESTMYSQSPESIRMKIKKNDKSEHPLFCSQTSYDTVALSLQERVLEKSHGKIIPMSKSPSKTRQDHQQTLYTQQDSVYRSYDQHPIYRNQSSSNIQLEDTKEEQPNIQNIENNISNNKKVYLNSEAPKNRFSNVTKENSKIQLKYGSVLTVPDRYVSRQSSTVSSAIKSPTINRISSMPLGNIRVSKEAQQIMQEHQDLQQQLEKQQELKVKQEIEEQKESGTIESTENEESKNLNDEVGNIFTNSTLIENHPSYQAISVLESPQILSKNGSQEQTIAQQYEIKVQEYLDHNIFPGENNEDNHEIISKIHLSSPLKQPIQSSPLQQSYSMFQKNSTSINPSQQSSSFVNPSAFKQSQSFPMEQQEFLKYQKKYGKSMLGNSSVQKKTTFDAIIEEKKNITRELKHHVQDQYEIREKYEGAGSKGNVCNCIEEEQCSCSHQDNKHKKEKIKQNLQLYHNEAFKFLMSMNTNLAHFKEDEQRRKVSQDVRQSSPMKEVNIPQNQASSLSTLNRNQQTQQETVTQNINSSKPIASSIERSQIYAPSQNQQKDDNSRKTLLYLTQRNDKTLVSSIIKPKLNNSSYNISSRPTLPSESKVSFAKNGLANGRIGEHNNNNDTINRTQQDNNNNTNKFLSSSLVQNSTHHKSKSFDKDVMLQQAFSLASPISKMYPLPCSMPTTPMNNIQLQTQFKLQQQSLQKLSSMPTYLHKSQLLQEKEHTVQSIMASTFCAKLGSIHRENSTVGLQKPANQR